MIEEISKCDYVVIPPDSESNVHPWLSAYAPIIREAGKPIFRIVNISREINSSGIIDEMVYLASLGIEVNYLFTNNFDQMIQNFEPREIQEIINAYEDEGKEFQFYDYHVLRSKLLLRLRVEDPHNDQVEDTVERIMNRCFPVMRIKPDNNSEFKTRVLHDPQSINLALSYLDEHYSEFMSPVSDELAREFVNKCQIIDDNEELAHNK